MTSFGLDSILFQLKYLYLPSKGTMVHMKLRGAIRMSEPSSTFDAIFLTIWRCIFDFSNSRISFKSKENSGQGWYGETEIGSRVEEGVYSLKFDKGWNGDDPRVALAGLEERRKDD